jgi:hypothetical protein
VPATARATIDHVMTRTLGGDDYENEVLACFRCNASKGKRTLAEWLESERCPVPRWRSFGFLFDVACHPTPTAIASGRP